MGPKKPQLPSTSKIVKCKSGWLGKAKTTTPCIKCKTVRSFTQTDCVICLEKVSSKNVMLPKCQHSFCTECIIKHMTSESDNIGIRLDKLDKKQLVADYLDLRSNNLQSAADFFSKSGYTSSLFHACDLSMDGQLNTGSVVMNANLKGLIQPDEVVERLINSTCQKKRGDRCTNLWRLVKIFTFDCPVCRYHYTDVSLADLQPHRLANNIIDEYSVDAKDNVQPPTTKSEAGATNVVVDHPEADPLVQNNSTPTLMSSDEADQIRTFSEGVHVAAVETDEELSLPESLPSQVLYAPEDDFLEEGGEEEEEEDAVVPQNPAETPPPSSDEGDNENQEPPQMVINVPQPNAPQSESERVAVVPPFTGTPAPEGASNTQQHPSRPTSPGILHYILLFNDTDDYAPQIVF